MLAILLFPAMASIASPEGGAPGPIFTFAGEVPLAVLPANERAVVGLALHRGKVLGVTTGLAGHLFAYDPATKALSDLHRLEDGAGFSFGLVAAVDTVDAGVPVDEVLAGTQRDPTGLGRKPAAEAVGRLLRFRLHGGPAAKEDLGAPVPGQGIYSLARSEKSDEVVGLTWPDGHFFACDRKTGKLRDLGAIAGHRTFEDGAPRQVARALVSGGDGAVYTSGKDGVLYRYDPASRSLSPLAARLPALPGRESWASLEAAAVGPDGRIYGGTSDGYLFLFDPASGAVVNLGKPIRQGGFDGLVVAPSGRLCAIAGERGGMPREVRFDPQGGGFTLGGIPRAGQGLSMEGFGAVIAGAAGTVYAGELDRIARLVIYRIE